MKSAPVTLALRACGPLAALSDADRAGLLSRDAAFPAADDGTGASFRARVAAIVARVRHEGDEALRALAREFDGVALESLEVPRARWSKALDRTPAPLRRALEHAAENLACAHRAFAPRAVEVETEPGVIVGRRPDPLARVGVYVPGGRAAYPSSLLMGVVPARVAGVPEIVVCSPPGADGMPPPVVLAAAAIAGADRVFALGGAGAIAAMAYGTASVPRVERILGPGNAWVNEAKRQLAREVPIDTPAGPSEILVIAGAGADPRVVALELLAQAEHDPDASAVALAIGERLAAAIAAALADALAVAPRAGIAAVALARRGAVLSAATLDEALAFANAFAAEHVFLALDDPAPALDALRHAGTVCVGTSSSVAFGDYLTGANHVLPTGGLAHAWSGLSTSDLVRWTSWQRVTPESARRLAADTAVLATAEGLPAHADAAMAHAGPAPRGGVPARVETPEPGSWRDGMPEASAVACAIDLSDNTGRFGSPPEALAALRASDDDSLARYPSPDADALCAALARHAGVDRACIMVGCGSDDVLDAAFRACAAPGDVATWCEPTFGMVPVLTRRAGLRAAPRPWTRDWDLDTEALLATSARLTYVCAPNNPTGTLAREEAIARVADRAAGAVILDEAYAEFAEADGTASPWPRRAARHDRLVVVRTLSKAFALAGLRIGWAIASPERIAAMEEARGPYRVGRAAERAAVAAVMREADWVRDRAAECVRLRTRFEAALRSAGFAALPSRANFVLVPIPGAARVAAAMRDAGVAVRCFERLPRIGDALRITIGPWHELEAALAALTGAARCA